MKRIMTAWILALVLLCTGLTAFADMPTEDRAGNPITVPEQVGTIISLAPSTTQILLDLELGDKIVATDTYSVGKEGLAGDLPAFDMMTPDVEQMLALSPDLIFVTGMSLADGSDPFTTLVENGICVAYVPSSDSIEGIKEDILFIGQLAGNAEGAQAIVDDMTAKIAAMTVETDAPIPVFFEVGFPYSLGSGTFINEMIEILGGKNIFADEYSWITVSDEAVVAGAPEIIFTNADWNPEAVSEILARDGWNAIPAVEKEQVYLINGDASSQPNQHIIEALEEMKAAFDSAK